MMKAKVKLPVDVARLDLRDNLPAAGAVDLKELVCRLFGKEIAARLRAAAAPK